MLFWIITTALASIVALTLIVPLLRQRADATQPNEDVGLYRDHLAEVDRDLERGVLDPQDAERTRTEISRRLLAADKAAITAPKTAPKTASLVAAGITAVALIGGSLWGYLQMGAPGYPDYPRADRIAASEEIRQSRLSQLEVEGLIEQMPLRPEVPAALQQRLDELQAIVATDPNDVEIWQQIAATAANGQQFAIAARAQQQVLALTGDQSARENMRLALMMILAADDYVSPEAEEVLRRVLEIDPENIPARYYFGLLYFSTDRPDRAFTLFRDVINDGTPDNPFVGFAKERIEEAAYLAGVEYTLPPPTGPSVDDMTAAQDMSQEDRDAMIADMVNRLSDRLATEGGPVQDWARLINALTVLGDNEQARAILLEARTLFATSPEAMEQLDFVATTTGLDE